MGVCGHRQLVGGKGVSPVVGVGGLLGGDLESDASRVATDVPATPEAAQPKR